MTKDQNIAVSDHAIIRYIERVYGVSLDPIRNEILQRVKPYAVTGLRRIKTTDGSFCIAQQPDNTMLITTILSPKMRATHHE